MTANISEIILTLKTDVFKGKDVDHTVVWRNKIKIIKTKCV